MTLQLSLPEDYPHSVPTVAIRNPRGIGDEEIHRYNVNGWVCCKFENDFSNIHEFLALQIQSSHLL